MDGQRLWGCGIRGHGAGRLSRKAGITVGPKTMRVVTAPELKVRIGVSDYGLRPSSIARNPEALTDAAKEPAEVQLPLGTGRSSICPHRCTCPWQGLRPMTKNEMEPATMENITALDFLPARLAMKTALAIRLEASAMWSEA